MAQQEKNREIEVREEIDAEDELDGWGPVRVRRSTIPSAPPDVVRVAGDSDPASGTEPTQNKTLMT
jgi:hypothetical protein